MFSVKILAALLLLSSAAQSNKANNLTVSEPTPGTQKLWACDADDITCLIRVTGECDLCGPPTGGTDSITYRCPTTPDCELCVVECDANEACQYSVIESNECDILIVSAESGERALLNSVIDANNSDNVEIIIGSSVDGDQARFMTIYGSSITDSLIVNCNGSCVLSDIYCPTESASGGPSCFIDCNGINSDCRNVEILSSGGTPRDVKLDCASDENICQGSTIGCDDGTCAMQFVNDSWDCVGNCSIPTMAPTINPSAMPSFEPSSVPSAIPSVQPTQVPTDNSSVPITSDKSEPPDLAMSTGPGDPNDPNDSNDPDTPNSSTNKPDDDSSGGANNQGGDDSALIAGILIPVLLLLCAAGVFVWLWQRGALAKILKKNLHQASSASQEVEAQNLNSNNAASKDDKDEDDDLFDAPDPNSPATPGMTPGAAGATAGGDVGSEPVGAPLNGTAAQETQGEDDNVVVAEVVAIALVQDHVEGPTEAGPTPANQENAPATNEMTTGGDTTTPGEPIQRGNTDVEDIFDNPNEDAEKPAATDDQAADDEKPDEAEKPVDTEPAEP